MIEADQEVEVAKLSDFMTAMGAKPFNVSVNRVTTNAMMAAVPGLKAELKACKSGEDFEAAFQKYGPTIQSHLVIMGEAARCKGRAEELLVEEFVKALEDYIRWYNNGRIRCDLNGMSPVEYRQYHQAMG